MYTELMSLLAETPKKSSLLSGVVSFIPLNLDEIGLLLHSHLAIATDLSNFLIPDVPPLVDLSSTANNLSFLIFLGILISIWLLAFAG